MNENQLLDAGLEALIREHEARYRANPHGPWAEDSREIAAEARQLRAARRAEAAA